MPTVEQLEKKLRDSIGKRREQATIEIYCQALRRLCIFTKKTEWDKRDLLKYVDWMIGKDYTLSTIKSNFAVWKSIHKFLSLPYPLVTDDMPRGRIIPKATPVVRKDDIEKLILFTRKSGDPADKFFLSMSTLYGLRRVEMARLKSVSFTMDEVNDSSVSIETAKHGEPKQHLIPDCIEPYVLPMLMFLPYQQTSLSNLWNELCRKAGYGTKDYEGWHGIRRSLVTELVEADFTEMDIKTFMRWSQELSMVSRYNHPADPLKIDRKIFEKHPFLKYWE